MLIIENVTLEIFQLCKEKKSASNNSHIHIYSSVSVCVVLPVGRDVGGLCACESCLVTRWHAQWPIHHGAKLCVRVCMCDCVWQCAKVAKFKDKSLRKAQQKGSNKQRRNWNSQKATCTHTRTHSHTLTILFEFCNKCWTWQMKYLTPHKLRAPLSVFSCVRIIIVEF